MPVFEFETKVKAPSQEEAIRIMECLNFLGTKLTLRELELLKNTIGTPALYAQVKQKLGIQ
jgi:hypothetical protein